MPVCTVSPFMQHSKPHFIMPVQVSSATLNEAAKLLSMASEGLYNIRECPPSLFGAHVHMGTAAD